MEFLVSILTSIHNLFYPPTPKNQNFWNNFSPEIFSTPTSCFGSQRSFLRKTNKKFASLLNLCIKLLTNNWEPCFTIVLIRQNIITLRFISLGLIYVIFSFAKWSFCFCWFLWTCGGNFRERHREVIEIQQVVVNRRDKLSPVDTFRIVDEV